VNRLLISKAITDTSDELILTLEAEHENKLQALKLLFEEFLNLEEYDFKTNGLTILIPSHIVSVLIGKGGSQIKKFQTQSRTEISVIDKMEGMQERQVRIHGFPDDIKNAIESIHRLIKDRVISPEPNKGDSVNKGKTFIKFIVPKSSVGILIGKGGSFAKEIKGKYSAEIKLLKNERCSSRELENVAVKTR
jgi:predicted PilT family ATPase